MLVLFCLSYAAGALRLRIIGRKGNTYFINGQISQHQKRKGKALQPLHDRRKKEKAGRLFGCSDKKQ